jgi:hypothetical protein
MPRALVRRVFVVACVLALPLLARAAVDLSTCAAADCCWGKTSKERFCACGKVWNQ